MSLDKEKFEQRVREYMKRPKKEIAEELAYLDDMLNKIKIAYEDLHKPY